MSTLFNALKDFAFENAVPLLTSLFLLTAAFAAAVLVYPPGHSGSAQSGGHSGGGLCDHRGGGPEFLPMSSRRWLKLCARCRKRWRRFDWEGFDFWFYPALIFYMLGWIVFGPPDSV